ncbi:hypothetical protein GCM10009716_11470 [Streptomyces sodiiphilus]|uniref:Uncharacterized protein n=1 Tax=Streptomyces sodiiphilus TaxID=226217 RepID=A0ABP5A498_9ACTN
MPEEQWAETGAAGQSPGAVTGGAASLPLLDKVILRVAFGGRTRRTSRTWIHPRYRARKSRTPRGFRAQYREQWFAQRFADPRGARDVLAEPVRFHVRAG